MGNIFQKIANFFLTKNNGKKSILSAKIGEKKIYMTQGECLEIQSQANAQKTQIEAELTEIFEKYLHDQEGLFKFLKENGVMMYKIKHADLILEFLAKSQGYIPPQKFLKALILNIFLKRKFSFSTGPMFIFEDAEISIITLYYEIYKWYFAQKSKLGTVVDLDKITDSMISTLSYEEAFELRQMVHNDINAIDFVLKFVKNHQSAKDAKEQIENEGSVNI